MSKNKKSPLPLQSQENDKKSYELLHQNEIYSSTLLRRPYPEGYNEDHIKSLKQHTAEESIPRKSLLVFRIQNEWLALPSHCIKEVTPPSFVHRLPHTNNPILLGITNVQGELLITISMQNLLGITNTAQKSTETYIYSMYARNIVFGYKNDIFVFPVDEIYGLSYVKLDTIEPIPISILKSLKNFFSGIFTLPDAILSVGLLNEQLIINSLNKNHL